MPSSTPTVLDGGAARRDAPRPSTGSTPTAACRRTTPSSSSPPGASGVEVGADDLRDAVTEVCASLARQLVADAEGAHHDIAVEVVNAASLDDALEVARSVARNNLFKCAVFGNDPNWGRVLAAVGTTAAAFDPTTLDVSMNGVQVCRAGGVGEDRSLVDLTAREVHVVVDLHAGDTTATVWTNDLTHDYVHENSAYST